MGNAVVHEQNSDIWEFGEGALSELRVCGIAVLQCCGQWVCSLFLELIENTLVPSLQCFAVC